MKNKIMIVDDEKYIRQLYAEELDDEGYQVVTISSGLRLLEKIENEDPDLVILDVRLRDYNGLELLQDIKKRFSTLPVGLCTAYDTFRGDKKSAGADFYVVRSFDLTELKDNIAHTLEPFGKGITEPKH
jgi:two-component system response regulator (stage 0 sporulation protein F)